MKEFVLINSDNGFIVEEVDARSCKYCSTAFIYKDEDNIYYLVDKETGLAITRCKQLKGLENMFWLKKKQYDSFRITDSYKIKVERFEKMKVTHNMKGKK